MMTGPDGATSIGWWRFLSIDRPRLIEFEDGFSNPDGTPNTSMPSMRSSAMGQLDGMLAGR
jgi:hypothetical protein